MNHIVFYMNSNVCTSIYARVCMQLWSMVMNPNPYAGQNVVEVILYHVYKPAAPLTTVGDHLELQPLGQYDGDFSWWTIHLANSDDPRYFGNSQVRNIINYVVFLCRRLCRHIDRSIDYSSISS